MKLLLAGATGVVGALVAARSDAAGHDLVIVGRRPVGRDDHEIITNFRSPVSLPQADAAICTLGTTMAKAGSKEAFYAVDHDAVLTFADAARAAGAPHLLVVTAVGANPDSAVYYSRVKGEVERDLGRLGFRRIDFIQPGLLLGPRQEKRPVERLMKAADPVLRTFMVGPLSRYAGIPAATVASAVLSLCENGTEPGTFRHQNRGLRQLAQGRAIST